MSIKIHKHGGEVLKFNIDNERVRDIVRVIVQNQNNASLTLAVMLDQINNRTMHVFCKQCMLDAALQFRDAASAIEELMELK